MVGALLHAYNYILAERGNGMNDSDKKDLRFRTKLSSLYSSLGYKVLPEMPPEEDCRRIIESYKTFPASLAGKNNMNETCGNLRRGHVVMLWWLSNPRTNKKRVPSYFLYEYGLDFSQELKKLEQFSYLKKGLITEKGLEFLKEHDFVIAEHKSNKTYSADGTISYSVVNLSDVTSDFVSSGDFVRDQQIGRELERIHDFENAIKAYYSAWKLAEKDPIMQQPPPNVFTRLSMIYRKQKMIEKEIEILEIANKIFPEKGFDKKLLKATSTQRKEEMK